MFTGLIETVGRITSATETAFGLRLVVHSPFQDLSVGESISIDGVCLTAVKVDRGQLLVDLSPETVRLARAQFYKVGDLVNLERALKLGDRLGGHIVQGHVDLCGTLSRLSKIGDCHEIEIRAPWGNSKAYLVPKGSISVNGISLTLNSTTDSSFTCMIIPHTWSNTNLCALQIGDMVNIEWDWLAKLFLNARELGPKS